ncbi:hypothetical protein GH733_007217 [Mirounga leonina]|nr:hypothetical protein GH733_007217 [Mirounga leonina]
MEDEIEESQGSKHRMDKQNTIPPQIMNISSDITVNEGSSVTLLCLAIGRPEPTVTWRHLSVKEGQGFVSEDEYLEISDIKRDQSGEYECSALNDVAAPDVRKVKITVNYPPYISKAKNTGVSVGQKGILSCEASAVPMAEFQWFKEDTRLATGLGGVRIENKGHISTLTFFNVSEKDYGNYTCVATNKLGNSNASITLYAAETVAQLDCAFLPSRVSYALYCSISNPCNPPSLLHLNSNPDLHLKCIFPAMSSLSFLPPTSPKKPYGQRLPPYKSVLLVLAYLLSFTECRRYGLMAPPDPSINFANEPSEETEA